MPGERAQVVERAPTSPMSRARAKLLACLIGGSDKKRWFLCGYWPTLGETFPDRSEVMPNLLGGLVGGLNCILCLAVMASIYFSPFNFVSGEAASEATSLGMTMLLFTSSISIVVSALFGRLQYAIVASQDVPAVLLALTVPRIIAHTMGDDDGIIGDDEHGVMSEEDKARKALLSTPRTCLTSSPFSPSLGLGVRGRDACLPRHLVGRLLYRLLLLLRRSNEAGPPVISGLLASIGLLAIRGGLAHASRVPFQYLWPIHWVPGFFSPCAAVSSAVAVEGVYSLSD